MVEWRMMDEVSIPVLTLHTHIRQQHLQSLGRLPWASALPISCPLLATPMRSISFCSLSYDWSSSTVMPSQLTGPPCRCTSASLPASFLTDPSTMTVCTSRAELCSTTAASGSCFAATAMAGLEPSHTTRSAFLPTAMLPTSSSMHAARAPWMVARLNACSMENPTSCMPASLPSRARSAAREARSHFSSVRASSTMDALVTEWQSTPSEPQRVSSGVRSTAELPSPMSSSVEAVVEVWMPCLAMVASVSAE